jgi:hypothetical protein
MIFVRPSYLLGGHTTKLQNYMRAPSPPEQELRAAGITSSGVGGGKKRKYIDYGREIPFEKTGFFEDVIEVSGGGGRVHEVDKF